MTLGIIPTASKLGPMVGNSYGKAPLGASETATARSETAMMAS